MSRRTSVAGALLVAISLSVAALSGGAPAHAQGLSSHPITFVVPFTPGTGPDVLARLIGGELQKRWKQSVIVENKPGASGNIGTLAVARSEPNGHTILVTTNQLTGAVSFFNNIGYDPIEGFNPIVKIGVGGIALCVHPSVPAENLSQFLAYVKSKNGDFNYGSPGNGGPHHLAMERLKQITGLDIKHVPYRGSSGAAQDLVGGHVSAGFLSLTVVQPLVESKSIKVIGVALNERLKTSPGLPTIAEQGVSGFEVALWFGMLAPAGTSPEIVAKYNKDVNEIMRDPAVIEAAGKAGIILTGGTPQEFRSFLVEDLALWKRVTKEAGLAAN